MMSLIHEKEDTTDLILESDGTLTIEGVTYIYLGNYTLDEFQARSSSYRETRARTFRKCYFL